MKERSGGHLARRRWRGVVGVEGRGSEVGPGARLVAAVEERSGEVDGRAGAGAEVT